MDAAAGGAFFSLDVAGAKVLIDKIASNQSWKGDRQPAHANKYMKLTLSMCWQRRWIFSWKSWNLHTKRLTRLWSLR
jgi:hypothetical protein